MNEEVLLGFYWESLNKAETIISELEKNNQPVTPEAKLIKGLAFAGLIRQHAKFHLVQPDKEITTTKKVGFISITSTEDNQDFESPKIIIKDPNGFEHECETTVLQPILGPEFAPLILKKTVDGTEIRPASEIKFVELSEEQMIEEEETLNADSIAEESQPSTDRKDRLPEFIKDGRYKDDVQGIKLWDTFTYNHHALSLEYNGESGTIHFYVYPLAIKQNELATDIMVIAESGEVCRANVSRGTVSSVELNFGDIPFMIRGSFKDGKFHSIVKPMIQELIETTTENIYPHEATNRTSTTFVQSEYHGILFNIFPAKFKKDEFGDYIPANGSNGYTPAGIVIERDHHVEVLTPTSEGIFNVLGNNGETILIETYWNHPKLGETFNYHFDS